MNSNSSKIKKNSESPQQMSCQEFRELLDRREKPSGESCDRFNEHLKSCRSCAAEVKLENILRDVIVPTTIPSVSPGFESRLKAHLPLESNVREHRYSWFGWALPVLTIVLLGFIYLKGIWSAVHRFAILLYAEAAGHFAGWTALNKESLVAKMTFLQGMNAGLVMNVFLALIVVSIGFVAANWSSRHYPVSVS